METDSISSAEFWRRKKRTLSEYERTLRNIYPRIYNKDEPSCHDLIIIRNILLKKEYGNPLSHSEALIYAALSNSLKNRAFNPEIAFDLGEINIIRTI